ncbi:hypothetical protein ABIE09_001174 [Lysobacter enzymogenes]
MSDAAMVIGSIEARFEQVARRLSIQKAKRYPPGETVKFNACGV